LGVRFAARSAFLKRSLMCDSRGALRPTDVDVLDLDEETTHPCIRHGGVERLTRTPAGVVTFERRSAQVPRALDGGQPCPDRREPAFPFPFPKVETCTTRHV